MKPLRDNLARAMPAARPAVVAPRTTPRRRHRQREAHRLTGSLCAVGFVACLLIVYVFGCALVAQHHYRTNRLRVRLERVQNEHRRLEGRVADLLRQDRILSLAGQQGMEPRETLQYVKLPQSDDGSFRQASAR